MCSWVFGDDGEFGEGKFCFEDWIVFKLCYFSIVERFYYGVVVMLEIVFMGWRDGVCEMV